MSEENTVEEKKTSKKSAKKASKKAAKKSSKKAAKKTAKKTAKADGGVRKGKPNLRGKFGEGRTPARMLGRVVDAQWNKYHKAAKAKGKTFSAWARDILDEAVAG